MPAHCANERNEGRLCPGPTAHAKQQFTLRPWPQCMKRYSIVWGANAGQFQIKIFALCVAKDGGLGCIPPSNKSHGKLPS
eukprot:4109852-Amphidinium_carterae.2